MQNWSKASVHRFVNYDSPSETGKMNIFLVTLIVFGLHNQSEWVYMISNYRWNYRAKYCLPLLQTTLDLIFTTLTFTFLSAPGKLCYFHLLFLPRPCTVNLLNYLNTIFFIECLESALVFLSTWFFFSYRWTAGNSNQFSTKRKLHSWEEINTWTWEKLVVIPDNFASGKAFRV